MASPLIPLETALPTPAEWRAAMGAFPTGVTVVTTWGAKGQPLGSTINAFCSVSLSPPMLLICLDLANPLCGPVQACGVFGVNFLGEDAPATARCFATTPEEERFREHPFRSVGAGAPQLDCAPVFIDCAVETIVAAGDHLVVVGRGLRTEQTCATAPLLYHRGRFHRLPPP
jgi:flavin reductase (DIM6/NTAB) family NADH-FMN oxidoreductase RutF